MSGASLRTELLRRLRAAAEAFGDPDALQPEESGFQREPEPERPEPIDGARHCVVVVLDSCRYDSFVQAGMGQAGRLGDVEQRWSYATWTAPSHYNLLTGLLPHRSPTGVHASRVYEQAIGRWSERLGAPVDFARLLPDLWLPTLLRHGLGYETRAWVSLPVLNPRTGIARDFERYTLMEDHADFGGILDRLTFGERPSWTLLNLGETHYPYDHAGAEPLQLPRLSGVHGVAKQLAAGQAVAAQWFDEATFQELRRRQVAAAACVDGLLERLFDQAPAGTWFVITSDHGELFGEGGYFGHGPVQHDAVLAVPFVEGQLR